MPPGKRSLRALAEEYARQNRYKTASTAFGQLTRWSSEYAWQARIAGAVTEGVTRKLEEAAELDADTFVETARRFNELIHAPGFFDAHTLARIRESVRKTEPKGAMSVNVNVLVEVERVVERIAEEEGLTDDEKRELLTRLSSRVVERR